MPFDSLVRTKQVNKPEFSGYIVDVLLQYLRTGQITGIAMNTGQLTGQFYPLRANPSGYVTTGYLTGLATRQDVSGSATAVLTTVNLNYYPRSNPSGYGPTGNLPYLKVDGSTTTDGHIYLYDSPNGRNAIEYRADDYFYLRGTAGSEISLVPYGFVPHGPYISGFEIWTNSLNGQPPMNGAEISGRFVPWDYFDSGKGLSFDYFQLSSLNWPVALGGGLLFQPDSYFVLGGTRQGYPSESHVIDLFGAMGGLFGRTTNRPYIKGFDIEAYSISSSGYDVLTTRDGTGYASKTDLRITSGVLSDQNWQTYTELHDYMTGVPSKWLAPNQLTGEITIVGLNGVSISTSGQNLVIGAGTLSASNVVYTTGDQTIDGVKSFVRNGVVGGYSHIALRADCNDSPVFLLGQTGDIGDGNEGAYLGFDRTNNRTLHLGVGDWHDENGDLNEANSVIVYPNAWLAAKSITVNGNAVATSSWVSENYVSTGITGASFAPVVHTHTGYITTGAADSRYATTSHSHTGYVISGLVTGRGNITVSTSGAYLQISGATGAGSFVDDGTFVRTTGNQNIGDAKNFTSILTAQVLKINNGGKILDYSSNMSIDPNSRWLQATYGTDTEYVSLNWALGRLYEGTESTYDAGQTSLDWQAKILSGNWTAQGLAIPNGGSLTISGNPVSTGTSTFVDDGTFVRTTGNQAIDGTKQFSSAIVAKGLQFQNTNYGIETGLYPLHSSTALQINGNFESEDVTYLTCNEDFIAIGEPTIRTIIDGSLSMTFQYYTPQRVLTLDANSDVQTSSVSTTELGYLQGTTGSIQTQLDSKTTTGWVTGYVANNTPTLTDVVYTTGTQTIAGTKTFTGQVSVNSLNLTGSTTGRLYSLSQTPAFQIGVDRNLIIQNPQLTAGGIAIGSVNDTNGANLPLEYRASEHTFSVGGGTVTINGNADISTIGSVTAHPFILHGTDTDDVTLSNVEFDAQLNVSHKVVAPLMSAATGTFSHALTISGNPVSTGASTFVDDGTYVRTTGNQTVGNTKNFTGILQWSGNPVTTGGPYYLASNPSSYISSAATTGAGGSNTHVQYNNNAVLGGKNTFTFNPTYNALVVGKESSFEGYTKYYNKLTVEDWKTHLNVDHYSSSKFYFNWRPTGNNTDSTNQWAAEYNAKFLGSGTHNGLIGGLRVVASTLGYGAGSGSVTNVVGLQTYLSNAYGTVTNMYNIQVSSPYLTNGITTNVYGVYLADQKQSYNVNAYGVYQLGINDINVFKGKTAIGPTVSFTPTAYLHLTAGGTGEASAPLKFTSAATTLTTPEAGAMEYDGTSFYLTNASQRGAIVTGAQASFVLTGITGGFASSDHTHTDYVTSGALSQSGFLTAAVTSLANKTGVLSITGVDAISTYWNGTTLTISGAQSSTSAGSQSPWTGNINANTFSITGVTNLNTIGKVNIGATGIGSYPLQVNTANNNDGIFIVPSAGWSASRDASIYLGATDHCIRGNYSSADSWSCYYGQAFKNGNSPGTQRMIVGYNAGPNVGIGTATPSYLLDVAGTGNFSSLALGGVNISNTYATVSNLNTTGSSLQTSVDTLNNWTGLSTGLYYPRTGQASVSVTSVIDWSLGSTFYRSLTAATTLSFLNTRDGATIVVAIRNTGTQNYAVTWPTTGTNGVQVKWPSGVPITGTAGVQGKQDIYTFIQIDTGIYANAVRQF